MARARPHAGRGLPRCADCLRHLIGRSSTPEATDISRRRRLTGVPRFREDDSGICARSGMTKHPQTKKDQLSLAQYREKLPCEQTRSRRPRGAGAGKSGPKGPGQRRIFLSQASGAGDGRKWGSNMILLTFP